MKNSNPHITEKAFEKSFKKIIQLRLILLTALSIFTTSSCKKFFDVEIDKSLIPANTVFNNNANATSALIGVYRTMASGSFLGGGASGISMMTGLSSDEFSNVLADEEYLTFQNNQIPADSRFALSFWTGAYKIIYQVNDIIEELNGNIKVDISVNQQLTGEALFIRAYSYFYLINLYGDVPLILNTRYQDNAIASRTSISIVYTQIIDDLLKAHQLLKNEYPTAARVRVNKLCASAMLARVYLYQKNWEEAKKYSTEVIANSAYGIEPDLNMVFKKGCSESIWELASDTEANTQEGEGFIIENTPGGHSAELTQTLLGSFESGDGRETAWIGNFNDGSLDVKFPFKYRERYATIPSENFVMLRLAEQFLIRAEAEAQLSELVAAANDLDVVRERAGLQKINTVLSVFTKENLLDAILKERRIEFFAEWGHRWFDLKRLNKANLALSPIKGTTWQATDVLYPIPQEELLANPFLKPQNSGY